MATDKTINYFLKANGNLISVGTTKPYYSRQKQGWITDAGVFSTKNPNDYEVSGTANELLPEALVVPPVPATISPVNPDA
jgi:hypothetical protein